MYLILAPQGLLKIISDSIERFIPWKRREDARMLRAELMSIQEWSNTRATTYDNVELRQEIESLESSLSYHPVIINSVASFGLIVSLFVNFALIFRLLTPDFIYFRLFTTNSRVMTLYVPAIFLLASVMAFMSQPRIHAYFAEVTESDEHVHVRQHQNRVNLTPIGKNMRSDSVSSFAPHDSTVSLASFTFFTLIF